MKYVYCIIRDNIAFPDSLPPGLGNADVYKVPFDDVAALVSHFAPGAIDDNIQNVIAHQEIINSLSGPSSSIIPCRFGASFQSDSDIISLLEKHHGVIDKYLIKLEGKMEIGVKAIFNKKASLPIERTPLSIVSGKIGTDYLLKKKEKFDAMQMLGHQADEVAKNLHQATSPLWTDVKVSKQMAQDALILNICYLVSWQNIHDFKGKYQEFENSNSNIKLLYTGTWPPYTFADINFSEKKR